VIIHQINSISSCAESKALPSRTTIEHLAKLHTPIFVDTSEDVNGHVIKDLLIIVNADVDEYYNPSNSHLAYNLIRHNEIIFSSINW
jgi:hypothetical protein